MRLPGLQSVKICCFVVFASIKITSCEVSSLTVYSRLGNFHVKNNSHKKFRVNKFSWFCLIHEIFLTGNGYNMDKHLESS